MYNTLPIYCRWSSFDNTINFEGSSVILNAINDWLKQIAHNYFLIVVLAVLFFAAKALIGFYTYRHYDKKIATLIQKVDVLLEKQKAD